MGEVKTDTESKQKSAGFILTTVRGRGGGQGSWPHHTRRPLRVRLRLPLLARLAAPSRTRADAVLERWARGDDVWLQRAARLAAPNPSADRATHR